MKSLQILLLICINGNYKLPEDIALSKIVNALDVLIAKEQIEAAIDNVLGYALTRKGIDTLLNIYNTL